jgi:hypothetical protein
VRVRRDRAALEVTQTRRDHGGVEALELQLDAALERPCRQRVEELGRVEEDAGRRVDRAGVERGQLGAERQRGEALPARQVAPGVPLVVTQMMASVSRRSASTTGPNTSRSCVPRPDSGSRAWTCSTEAPAAQASTPERTISSGSTGMNGVCSLPILDPVKPAVMMSFSMTLLHRWTTHLQSLTLEVRSNSVEREA